MKDYDLIKTVENYCKGYLDDELEIIKRKKEKKTLKIDKHLPQIILPANRLEMFIDWWNTDIRYENSIPHSFNSGYLILKDIIPKIDTDTIDENYSKMIKATAGALKMTYNSVKKQFIQFINNASDITIYFTFLDENRLYAETYDTQNEIISTINATVGEDGDSELQSKIDFNNSFTDLENFEDFLNRINLQSLGLLVTSLWYIATTTSTTKYIYEKITPIVTSRHKNVVNVSDTKTISTPIYDMKKIRTVKVESLVARKKGWTYSHAFQVHGHYRHYKSGKTIFIQPFVKGRDKEFKAQTITLNPEE